MFKKFQIDLAPEPSEQFGPFGILGKSKLAFKSRLRRTLRKLSALSVAILPGPAGWPGADLNSPFQRASPLDAASVATSHRTAVFLLARTI